MCVELDSHCSGTASNFCFRWWLKSDGEAIVELVSSVSVHGIVADLLNRLVSDLP